MAPTLGYPATLLRAADFDRDGDVDIFAASWAKALITVLHGDGRGGIEAVVHQPLAEGMGPSRVRLEDLDRDGDITACQGSHSRARTTSPRWRARGMPIRFLTGEA